MNDFISVSFRNWDPYRAEEELKSKQLPEPLYNVNFEQAGVVYTVVSVAQWIFSWLFFPVQIQKFSHKLAKRVVLPSAWKDRSAVIRFGENWPLDTLKMSAAGFSVWLLPVLSEFRLTKFAEKWIFARNTALDRYWEFKRFCVGVNGEKIDAIFLRQKKLHQSNRILFYCCSENELAEGKIYDTELLTLANKTHSHVIVWNYSGIGASTGGGSQDELISGCRAMLQCIERLGFKEIISYGHGLGAAVLLSAHSQHRKKEDVVYTVVARSPFATLSQAISCQYGFFVKLFVRFSGWYFDNVKVLNSFPYRTLILHTAAVKSCEYLKRPSQIIPDGVLDDPDASLGVALLAKAEEVGWNQEVIGFREVHNEPLAYKQIEWLAKEIIT